ncbi:sensor histidine kinase [Phaeacidiphilus oryzae]|uniref:sensor histidine kinase n=1 Tax=Phaeacidiphilus oryzae TaxID=348818 RepID=UPI000689E804|nr:ATP-binding protein [Phaeacidiphilus oryzae]
MVRSGSSPGPDPAHPYAPHPAIEPALPPAPPARSARWISVLAWLVPPALTAAATAVAVPYLPADSRSAIGWAGGIATLVVLLVSFEAGRRGRRMIALRRADAEHSRQLTDHQTLQAAEAIRLSGLLPEAIARLSEGEAPDEIVNSLAQPRPPENTPLPGPYRTVLRSVVQAIKNEADLRDSAQHAFVNIARRVQAIVHQQAKDLREMEDRHGRNPEVFGDLLRIDHGTALVGRLADSIAVLGGARPGRQWHRDIPLYSVLRGAMSRILDYQRVDLHSVAEVAIKGQTVEPLIHALAELLDNATRYSPPQTRVHLTAVEVQAGVAVEIEDGGVGLSDEAQARAELVLRQAGEAAGFDLSDLGETPRLGLSVAGRLAKSHRFQISLRPSAYSGVRAVLVVPQEHLAPTQPDTRGPRWMAAGQQPPQGAPRRGGGSPWVPRVEDPDQALRHPKLPRTPYEETPEAVPSVLQEAMPRAQAAARRREQRPARPKQQPSQSPMVGLLDEQPVEPYTINDNGLPQRRRHSFGTNPYGAAGPALPGTRSAAGGPAGGAAGNDVEPGLWLAAFTEGISGGNPGADEAAPASGSGTGTGSGTSAGNVTDQEHHAEGPTGSDDEEGRQS